MRAVCLLLLASLAGCAGSGFGIDPPYRFRQSLIDPEAGAPVTPLRQEPRARTVDPARCRRLLGRRLGGELELVRACTGVGLRRAPALEQLAGKRSDPEPLELVGFRAERPILGVVVARSGSRIEFLFLREGRVALGVLNTAQPHRRRLPGSARIENSYLRVIQRDDPPATRYLAGELLAGFAAPAL